MPSPVRVLVVYGSQTGNTEKVIKMLMRKWDVADAKFKVEGVQEGNEVDVEEVDSLPERYDVIVVATSSYGEGDPPDNYGKFLLKLIHGAQSGKRPMAGMQHAVLGEGSSVYEQTFQNCPRLTDKLLEECGSRRMVRRHEIDVGGTEEDESVGRGLFGSAVLEALQSLPSADAAPAAAWAEPRAAHNEPVTRITEKTEKDMFLGGGSNVNVKAMVLPITMLLVAAGAAAYSFFGEQ
mmetsp:Transcript_8456/g.21738  ORF Transcript_8456/g.21738 Transcript_8456/m.21738 type:complete len:236 (+) Transcript_8456:80-787(+)